jgi:hypothetical protein
MNNNIMEQIYAASIGGISGVLAWIKLNIIGVIATTGIQTSAITCEKISEVILYAAIGTIIGLIVRELWTFGKKLIKKRK